MTNDNAVETKITVEKLRNGRWSFVLHRGAVVYPAQGQFSNMIEAQAAAQAALKALTRNG